MEEILGKYPMRVPPYYLSLVDWEKGDADPICRLCVPSLRETDLGGSFDTSGEAANTKIRGLQHKYRQTALVLTTDACAMYCRHCFRKRLVGTGGREETACSPHEARDYVLAHPEISNVLLSGGDPFMMDNGRIRTWLDMLSGIPHLDWVY